MKIAIFGGLGFAGFALGKHFKKTYSDWDIHLYDNLSRRGSELNIENARKLDLRFTHCDIRNIEDFQDIRCDILVDASADPSVLSGIDGGASKVISNNLTGSLNLIELALSNKAKFIFISTSRVYSVDSLNAIVVNQEKGLVTVGDHQRVVGVSSKGISETFSTQGYKSYYGATKYCVEQLIQEYVQYMGLQATITRFGVLAGPGQFGKIDQGILMFWLMRHYWKMPLSYIGYGGKGSQVRDFLHIDDFCDIIEYQINHFDQLHNQIFNIGGGIENSASLSSLTQLAQEFTGNQLQIRQIEEARSADIPWYVSDNTKFKTIANWEPKRDLNSIFADSFEWLNANESELKVLL